MIRFSTRINYGRKEWRCRACGLWASSGGFQDDKGLEFECIQCMEDKLSPPKDETAPTDPVTESQHNVLGLELLPVEVFIISQLLRNLNLASKVEYWDDHYQTQKATDAEVLCLRQKMINAGLKLREVRPK